MLRIALGVVVGFFIWILVWFGSETILSVVWPAFGEHQAAFQEKLEKGPRTGDFYPDSTILVVHCVMAVITSLIAGYISARIAGDTKRAPIILGVLLLAMGLVKVGMSWPYVPIWYHLLFIAILLPMAVLGGKLKSNP